MTTRRCRCRPRGFTLVETMLALLLLALLASAAALTFSKPIAQARGDEAVDLLGHFDATTRTAAMSSGRTMRLTLDLSSGQLARRDVRESDDPRFTAHLPPGCRIAAVRIGEQTTTSGEVPVDISAMGLSRTYAVHVVSPVVDQWLVFAGFSGEMAKVDESALADIFDARP